MQVLFLQPVEEMCQITYTKSGVSKDVAKENLPSFDQDGNLHG
jgi:hypothetical protein